MVFYDISGIRQHYLWMALFFVSFFGLLSGALLFFSLEHASSSTILPYTNISNDAAFDKTIALTFDDGPHPKYTPELMALLKTENVPATFFLIGKGVIEYPDVARSIVEEGFEIGNHTFTHSEHMADSAERLRYELVSTEQIIRNATERETKLFRPPFLEDVDVGEFDGGRIDSLEVKWAEDTGYIVVGATLDTRDWNVADNGTQIILERLYERLPSSGPSVILMHEHAGDGATIEALRTFIPDMKARGYRFVFVSSYFGLTPEDVMPSVTQRTFADHFLVHAARTYVMGSSSFNVLIFLISVIGIVRLWTIIALRKAYIPLLPKVSRETHTRPSLSIVVPAYNEAANIKATIRSVFRSIGPDDELIVVDDGSTDETSGVVRALQNELGPQLILLQKENGGTKGFALAHALARVRHEILICIDADTIIAPGSLDILAAHFDDPRIAAVAGKIYPARRHTLLGTFQYLEYMQGQNLDKTVFAAGNAIGVVPGALGAWRKDAIRSVGGFPHDTVVEDQDLTLALIAQGYQIAYEPLAKAYTETPNTIATFFAQRSRWVFGTLQCAWKYRTWLFSSKRSSLGYIILPNIIFFNLLIPVLVPVVDIVMILSLFRLFDISLFLLPFIIFTLLEIWCTLEGIAYERAPLFRLVPLIFWQRLFYRYLMAAAILKAFKTAFVGTLVRWGVHQRRGECHTVFDTIVTPPSARVNS